jgi:hypothetical protein
VGSSRAPEKPVANTNAEIERHGEAFTATFAFDEADFKKIPAKEEGPFAAFFQLSSPHAIKVDSVTVSRDEISVTRIDAKAMGDPAAAVGEDTDFAYWEFQPPEGLGDTVIVVNGKTAPGRLNYNIGTSLDPAEPKANEESPSATSITDDGTYRVGVDIESGKYRVEGPRGTCRWTYLSADGADLGGSQKRLDLDTFVRINGKEWHAVKVSGCTRWSRTGGLEDD